MQEKSILKVSKLPKWQIEIEAESITFGIGDTIRRKLKPKDAPTSKELKDYSKRSEQRFEIITLRVDRQEPLELELAVKAGWCRRTFKEKELGVPAIMVIKEAIAPFDPLKIFEASYEFPGDPIAFAMGAFKESAILNFRPDSDGFLQVVYWLIRGPLKVLPDERSGDLEEHLEETARRSGIPIEQLKVLIEQQKLAELLNRETFIRAWKADGYDKKLSSNKWKGNKVELTIRKGPDDAPLPQDLLQNALSKTNIEVPSQELTEEQKSWISVEDKSKAFILKLEKKFEEWVNRGFVQDITDNYCPFNMIIDSWIRHPFIVSPLLALERKYRGWSEEDTKLSVLFLDLIGGKVDLETLESKSSDTLSKMMESVGAIDGIIVDKRGEVIVAVKPETILNLSNDESWSNLASNTKKDILITEPHVFQHYDFKTRTVAVKIRDGQFLGWVILELYIEPIKEET